MLEGEIYKARTKLEDAVERRDYAAAARIQRKLDNLTATREHVIQQANVSDKNSELDRLEKQRQKEEEDLKRRMSERMDRLLHEYNARLEQMERRHAAEITRIDRKYSDVRYSTPRTSPFVNVLSRAEDFYARHRDYAVAATLQRQGIARKNAEMDALDERTEVEVQAQIDAIRQKQELEIRGFRSRLEGEKMKLNKETAKALMVMRNRYRKLRGRILGLGEPDPLPEHKRDEGRGVYQELENGFAPMLATLDRGEYAPVPPLSARTLRNTFQTETFASIAQTPRVQRALERSMMRRSLEPL